MKLERTHCIACRCWIRVVRVCGPVCEVYHGEPDRDPFDLDPDFCVDCGREAYGIEDEEPTP